MNKILITVLFTITGIGYCADEVAKRDDNFVPVLLGVTDTGDIKQVAVTSDGALKIDIDTNSVVEVSTLTVTKSAYLATQSGNIGIGTTSPNAKLHINNGVLKVVSNGLKFSFYENDVAEGNAFFKLDNATSGTGIFSPTLWMKSNKTDSSYANSIIADVTQDIAGQGAVFSFMARANNGIVSNRNLFSFDNYGNNPAMVIKANGNIGIGKTNPQAKLQISSSATSGFSLGFAGAFETLPTSVVIEGTLAYQTSDHTLYVSTEAVVGSFSWKPVW